MPDASDVVRFLEAHRLPVTPLEQPAGGVVNVCYLTEQHAVRINVRDLESDKFTNEAVALARAAAAVPVPEVVLLDDSRSVLPWDVLVTTRIRGTAVETLPPTEQARFAGPAGALLARLHTVELPHFGWQTTPGPGHLRAHLEQRWERAVRYAAEHTSLTTTELTTAQRRLFEHVPEGVAPTLTHHDWHFGNLLQHEGVLVAAVDFEWSTGDDPLFDLDDPLSSEALTAELVAGYQTVRPLPDGWREQLDRYAILTTLEYVPIVREKLGPVHAWARDELRRRLASLRARLGA